MPFIYWRCVGCHVECLACSCSFTEWPFYYLLPILLFLSFIDFACLQLCLENGSPVSHFFETNVPPLHFCIIQVLSQSCPTKFDFLCFSLSFCVSALFLIIVVHGLLTVLASVTTSTSYSCYFMPSSLPSSSSAPLLLVLQESFNQ
jgi:hypothetical protein